MSLLWTLCVAVLVLLIRFLYCLKTVRDPCHKSSTPKSTLVVLGSGGHTSEMLSLVRTLLLESREYYSPISFVLSNSDHTSLSRLKDLYTSLEVDPEFTVHTTPRSRHVGQSYFSSIFTTLYAICYSLFLYSRIRPRVLLCNGPGTCLPLCAVAFLSRVLALHFTEIIYIESFCRVNSLSLTGKLVYPISSVHIVQWPQLVKDYPHSKCLGFVY